MGVLQMPRLKGADVQFIIYVPHDGQSASHEAKIKKKIQPTPYLVSRLAANPILYHPVISFPRAAITPNVLSPLVHLTLFSVSLPLVFSSLTQNQCSFLLAHYPLCVSSLYLSFIHPRQRIMFARTQVTATTLTSLASREILGSEGYNCTMVKKDKLPFN